jgi:hypothetical protein
MEMSKLYCPKAIGLINVAEIAPLLQVSVRSRTWHAGGGKRFHSFLYRTGSFREFKNEQRHKSFDLDGEAEAEAEHACFNSIRWESDGRLYINGLVVNTSICRMPNPKSLTSDWRCVIDK